MGQKSQRKEYEVLMSVMGQKDFSLGEISKINGDLLIINQTDENTTSTAERDGCYWRMISTTERGLSKSRNMALSNAEGIICQLCDDDEIMEENCEEIIKKAYWELPDASLIAFNLDRLNNPNQGKYYKIEKVQKPNLLRGFGSPAFTFKLDDIRKAGISFNENFGSGTQFGGGEDILFVDSVRKAGLKIYEYPATIATIDYGRFGSQWMHGYNEKYFYNLGCFLQCRFESNPLLKTAFMMYNCYKLRNDKSSSTSNRLKLMRAGAAGYKQKMTYEEYQTKLKQ